MTTQAEFCFSWVYTFSAMPRPCGPEHLIHRERPLATQHSLRNCADHLAALSHVHDFDLNLFAIDLIHQSRGNEFITFGFFHCPGVFAIVMVSFLCLKFLIFAK